jgi:hypothetical protein
MATHFFDITFADEGPEYVGRFEVEDPLDDALRAAGVGEVTGGGSGLGRSNVDVDASDLEAGLRVIRQVLRDWKVAPSTKIYYFGDGDTVLATYSVYEEVN